MKRFLIFFLLQLVLLLPLYSVARVVDGAKATHPVIQPLVDYLDANEIDTRNGGRRSGSVSTRPQVTELRNFQSDLDGIDVGDPFVPSFNAGTLSDRAFLVAVNSPGTAQPDELKGFKQIWDAASEDKRVFVSFSGKDLQKAQVLANGLRTQGYIVFLFKNNEANLPMVNAVETGQFFREAGHHLVVDTPNARTSAAVLAESLALSRPNKPGPIVVAPPPPPPPPPSSSASVPCCRVCTYRNGIQVGCGPIMCGKTQCSNARKGGGLFDDLDSSGLHFDDLLRKP